MLLENYTRNHDTFHCMVDSWVVVAMAHGRSRQKIAGSTPGPSTSHAKFPQTRH